jgi:hypothetical protein
LSDTAWPSDTRVRFSQPDDVWSVYIRAYP